MSALIFAVCNIVTSGVPMGLRRNDQRNQHFTMLSAALRRGEMVDHPAEDARFACVACEMVRLENARSGR
jgi:hypothetical protein